MPEINEVMEKRMSGKSDELVTYTLFLYYRCINASGYSKDKVSKVMVTAPAHMSTVAVKFQSIDLFMKDFKDKYPDCTILNGSKGVKAYHKFELEQLPSMILGATI